jgi:hypothetical protein
VRNLFQALVLHLNCLACAEGLRASILVLKHCLQNYSKRFLALERAGTRFGYVLAMAERGHQCGSGGVLFVEIAQGHSGEQ